MTFRKLMIGLIGLGIALASRPAAATTTSYFSGGQCTGFPFPGYAVRSMSSGGTEPQLTTYPEGMGEALMCTIERSSSNGSNRCDLTPATARVLEAARITTSSGNCSLVLYAPDDGEAISTEQTSGFVGSSSTGNGYTEYVYAIDGDYETYPFAYFLCDGHVLGYSIDET